MCTCLKKLVWREKIIHILLLALFFIICSVSGVIFTILASIFGAWAGYGGSDTHINPLAILLVWFVVLTIVTYVIGRKGMSLNLGEMIWVYFPGILLWL